MSSLQPDVYTFGTTATAARRLDLLAELYAPQTRGLLARWCPPVVRHAVDLGCGPGHTTRLLHEVSGAERTTGVERSPVLAAVARETAPAGVTIIEEDVAVVPLPVDPADVVHARFLLTHLAQPNRVLRGWAQALTQGGRLLVTETARLVSREPALGRYYELVGELQEHHGQSLDVGAGLADAAARAGLEVEYAVIESWHPPTDAMAALHVLNLRTWRDGEFARSAFDGEELDALDAALVSIAKGAPSEPIEQDLALIAATAA